MWMLTLSLLAPALADEPAAEPAAEAVDCATLADDAAKAACVTAQAEATMAEAKVKLEALGDCATQEGDAKTTCETEKAALEAQLTPAPAEEGKGGKAQRGNTNRMEQDAAEE